MSRTSTQSEALERVRKRVASWPRARWAILIAGIVEIAAAIYFLFWGSRYANTIGSNLAGYTPAFMFIFAVLGTKMEMLFALGVAMVAYALVRWRGRPEDILLVELADRIGRGSETSIERDG